MAKVTIKGIPQARDNALKFLRNTTKDKQFLDGLGQETANQIRNRTRDRKEEYKQAEIKDVTQVARKIYSDFYEVNEFSLPKKSNLTLTGQLLESIKHRVNQGISVISIYIDPNRRNRKVDEAFLRRSYDEILDKDRNATNSKGKPLNRLKVKALFLLLNSKPKNNLEIKDELEDRGRRFFFVSEKLNTLLTSKIAQQLRRKLALYNKIIRKLS